MARHREWLRLSATVRGALRSGYEDPLGRCRLPRALSGSALNAVLLSLSNRGFVRVNWEMSGRAVYPAVVIGHITPEGRKIAREGLS